MKKTIPLIAAGLGGAGLLVWNALRQRPEMDLHGKVVLITGGSRGLGLQLAREYCAHGVIIAICARDEAELDRAKPGSHLNAGFKGAHKIEYAWFSAAAATPLFSISAERAELNSRLLDAVNRPGEKAAESLNQLA